MQNFLPCFPSRKAALTTLNHCGLENCPQRLLSWKHAWHSVVLLGEWRLHAVRIGPQDHSYLSSGGLASHEAKRFFHWHPKLQAQKQESQPGIKTNLTFPTTHLPQVFCSTNGHRHALLTLHINIRSSLLTFFHTHINIAFSERVNLFYRSVWRKFILHSITSPNFCYLHFLNLNIFSHFIIFGTVILHSAWISHPCSSGLLIYSQWLISRWLEFFSILVMSLEDT